MPLAALDAPTPGTGDSGHLPVAEEEEVGTPIPAPGFLQVTERRRKYKAAAWHAPRGPVIPREWGPCGHILSKHYPSVVSTELLKLWARWASAVPSISGAPQKAFGPECGEQSWGSGCPILLVSC